MLISVSQPFWSFFFYTITNQSRSETSESWGNIWAFHIVAVCKVANYETKFKLLGKYIGDYNFGAWRMASEEMDF